MSFDQVVCTGVLHHLIDPGAGLSALRQVLKPEGAMHLMVYAPYGRAGIYMLQEFCRRLGIDATREKIACLLTALRMLPATHPLKAILTETPDFRSEAALADALLHPLDRAYTVSQFWDLLRATGMAFGRWIRQAPYSFHCGLLSRLSRDLQTAEPSFDDQCVAAELFRGTMMRHSAVAYRDDHPDASSQIRFSGSAWLSYIPIRVSDTITVRERLPAGSAAVLINRAHSYADIVLAISPRELRLLEAVNGRSTTAEIISQQHADIDATRCFFETLWWHDQVVLDASQRG
jgi:hypothetical protein